MTNSGGGWRKSSHSTGTVDSDCVEVTFAHDVLVRDSKNTSGPVLGFDAPAWQAFQGLLRRR